VKSSADLKELPANESIIYNTNYSLGKTTEGKKNKSFVSPRIRSTSSTFINKILSKKKKDHRSSSEVIKTYVVKLQAALNYNLSENKSFLPLFSDLVLNFALSYNYLR